MIAVGPAVPISRRSQMGVPVGVRANLALALAQGRYDVVHGFEPGLPSLSYLALRDTDALTVATFSSPERLSYPPARSQREKLLGRLDALLALSEKTRDAAAERFPGDYRIVSPGIDPALFVPAPKRRLDRRRAAAERARRRPQRPARAARAAGLGGGAAADEAADHAARDPARPRRRASACAPPATAPRAPRC